MSRRKKFVLWLNRFNHTFNKVTICILYTFIMAVLGVIIYGANQQKTSSSVTVTYSRPSYTVTFDPAGGGVSPSQKTVKLGEKYGDLPTPTRAGYTFMGWKNGSTTVTTSTQNTTIGDHKLTAQWSANTIKITLNKNGGSGGTDIFYYKYDTNKFYSDSTCSTQITSLTLPTRTGYDFSKYYGDGSCGGSNGETYVYSNKSFAGDLCTDIYKDATLYASWTPKTIKITLNKNGGSGGTDTFYYKYGTNKFYSDSSCSTQITSISKPSRTGYTFLNYHGDGTCGGGNGERYVAYESINFADDLCTDIYNDATLYAAWEANTYYVSYNVNYDQGDRGILTDCAQAWCNDLPRNKMQIYWNTQSFRLHIDVDNDPYGTIYQQMYLTAGQQYVIHAEIRDSNSTSGTLSTGGSIQIFYAINKSYTEAQSVRLSNSSQTATFSVSTTGTYNIRMDNDYHKEVYVFNFYVKDNLSSKSVKYGSTYGTLPIPSRPGCTFSGWRDSNGNIVSSSSTYSTAGNQTLTAVWTAPAISLTYVSGNSGYYKTELRFFMHYDEESEIVEYRGFQDWRINGGGGSYADFTCSKSSCDSQLSPYLSYYIQKQEDGSCYLRLSIYEIFSRSNGETAAEEQFQRDMWNNLVERKFTIRITSKVTGAYIDHSGTTRHD